MKKSITSLFLMLTCAFGAQAQTESYPFDAADLDANGWLWFDTAEKIEKYVGVSENGKLDPNGKIFQLITTNSAVNAEKPFNKTFADATIKGYGDPHNEGNDVKTGAIVIHQATDPGKYNNGGAVLINLPSCKEMHMNMSCLGAAHLYLSGTKDATADTSTYTIVYQPTKNEWIPGMIMYGELFRTNLYTWESIETLNNLGETEFTLTSNTPVFAMLQVAGQSPVFIHGIKIITENTTGINDIATDAISFDGKNISLDAVAEINVYNLSGTLVASTYASSMNLSNLTKGIYMVKAGNATQKVVIK